MKLNTLINGFEPLINYQYVTRITFILYQIKL